MPEVELDDAEKAALIEFLREEVEYTRWPFAPRTKLLRRVLDKLAPTAPAAEPLPPPKPPGERSMALNQRRRPTLRDGPKR